MRKYDSLGQYVLLQLRIRALEEACLLAQLFEKYPNMHPDRAKGLVNLSMRYN
jgi:hypothetical protein